MDTLRRTTGFLLLALLQVLMLNKLHLFGYATPFIYIYTLLKLPSSASRNEQLLWGFASGLIIDIFSNTPGMHAAATTLLAMLRPGILSLYQPKGDTDEYRPGIHAVSFSFFLRYTLTAVVIHHTALFALQAFSVADPLTLLLRTGSSTVLSILCLLVLDSTRQR